MRWPTTMTVALGYEAGRLTDWARLARLRGRRVYVPGCGFGAKMAYGQNKPLGTRVTAWAVKSWQVPKCSFCDVVYPPADDGAFPLIRGSLDVYICGACAKECAAMLARAAKDAADAVEAAVSKVCHGGCTE